LQVHIKRQTTKLIDEHVEGGRGMRMADLLASDDGVKSGRTTNDVVGFDGEHFSQGIGGAVSEKRPHFHLSEALTADLRLAAKRLLGNEGVWTNGTHVDLVLHHVV